MPTCSRWTTSCSAWGEDGIVVEQVANEVIEACTKIAPFIADTADELHQALARGDRMLFEGAQGVMLDIDYGTYPYVTSSNTGIGGIITGAGVSHRDVGEVIGILKAYTTRVGEGPFPVELHGDDGEALRQAGGEFGATTGRPRRCGWLDLVVAGFACRLNGIDTIALTKLDVLSGYETLPVCIGYRMPDGSELTTIPAEVGDLADAEPIYHELEGWSEPLSGITDFAALPAAAQAYIAYIEAHTGVRVGYIGTGPGREETIIR